MPYTYRTVKGAALSQAEIDENFEYTEDLWTDTEAARDEAVSGSNLQGNWVDQTGAASQPYSVAHDNATWGLTTAIADVTASEPSDSNTDWVRLSSSSVQPEVSTATATTTALGSTITKHLLTGVTAITGFTGTAGVTYHCRADGIFTLTHHATNLIVTQTGTSITTAAGDTFDVQMQTGTTCRIVNFERANGISTKTVGTAAGEVPTNAEIAPKAALYGCKISIGTDTEHDIDVAAGYKTLTTGAAFKVFTVSAITKQIDTNWVAGTGAGGFPAGLTLAASQWYYIFIIGKADGTVDVGFDTSATATNLLAVATGYTYYGILGAVKTDATSNVDSFVSAGAQEDFAGAVMLIEDQKAQGTEGGSFTSGALRTRDLNTIDTDNIPGSSLATNQFTLAPGKYKISWSAPAYVVRSQKTVLYNITSSIIEKEGSSEHSNDTYGGHNRSFGDKVASKSAITTYEIQHQCEISRATNGFGVATDFRTEVYAKVEIKVISLTLGDL